MDVVIDACATTRQSLVIAGVGPERKALEERAAATHADVDFKGMVPHAELGGLYDKASVTVLASVRGEGLPNVLLEAMAHGRPVVATPCAGTRGLIKDGINGLLVPPRDPAALAAVLNRLSANPGEAARLAAAGRATVEQYAWERVQPKLEKILERCRRR